MTDQERFEMNKPDELYAVYLPKDEAVLLKSILRDRAAYNLFTGKLKNWWVFTVAAGVLLLFAFGEKLLTLRF